MNIRNILVLVVIGPWTMLASPLRAQCDGCVANVSCSVDPAYPTLCPTQPPDATAGEPYSSDITFWLPVNFTDPGTGFNVDFMLMTITGVSGLPYGLDITYSEPSGVYHPQENQYGCARICGTPISAGTYTVTISILAGVEYNGFPINAVEQFPLTLVVQPGTSSNTSFSFTPTTGCGSAEVQFDALIDGQGSPVTYAWDFGNGNTGTEATANQVYNAPGTYGVSLQTSIGGYVLNNVAVGGVNDNWCGDVEEPSLFGSCTGDPDLYFVLTDGTGNTFTSATNDNSTFASWASVGQVLGNPPYSIAFFDEDLVSQDDDLGTFNMPQSTTGDVPFTLGNGTFGSLQIDLVPLQVFNDTDTVVVFAAPQPIIDYDTLDAQICVSDTGLVGITWFNDGDTVMTGNTCIDADSSGTWWAVVNNAFGCATSTDTVIICPTITIEQNGEVLYTATGLSNYEWAWNGDPLVGADGPFIIAETGGLYAVTATNNNGCLLHAEYMLLMTGEAARSAGDRMMHVYPNPTDGLVNVIMPEPGNVQLFDATGRPLTGLHIVQPYHSIQLDLRALANGIYFLRGSTAFGSALQPVIITR